MSTCQHICMCLGGVGGVGSDPQWKLWNPMDPKDEGSPGRGRGRGREHFFLLSGNLMLPRTCLHQTITNRNGLAKSQATGAQLESPDAIGSHIVLTLVSHRSHIGLTPSTPTTPRFFPILSEFLFRKVASISFVSKCCPNYSSTQPPQAPQEFCQRCPNSCFEMLPALVLFRNVARITIMEPLGKSTQI